MKFNVRQFHLQKSGDKPQDYCDSTACDLTTGRFAISDGASEADYSKGWADILTAGFVNCSEDLLKVEGNNDKARLSQWLQPLQKAWFESINWSKLQWHAKLKIQAQGGAYSFATFLGLEFMSQSPAKARLGWKALAVGDCVLFQVREHRKRALISAFPITESSQFNNTPGLFFSEQMKNKPSLERVAFSPKRYCKTGDTFFLCSDALAGWFLGRHEAGEKPWVTLTNLNSQEEYERLIAQLLTENKIRNDDTSVLVIKIG